ncbi:hypothetical protein AB0B10_25955 [Micromonospora arborensis]|uniref:hypothetical protein n=1 Tax=Micromonospora arborensis TaxID=2116518 RepID=UPI003410AA30
MATATITPGIRAIIDATTAFNAQYPGADVEIAAATPVVDVTWSTDGSGRHLTVSVTPGVVFADGEVAFGAEPTVFGPIRQFGDPNPITTVRWASRKAYDIPAGVLVRYFRAGRTDVVHTETA